MIQPSLHSLSQGPRALGVKDTKQTVPVAWLCVYQSGEVLIKACGLRCNLWIITRRGAGEQFGGGGRCECEKCVVVHRARSNGSPKSEVIASVRPGLPGLPSKTAGTVESNQLTHTNHRPPPETDSQTRRRKFRETSGQMDPIL